VKKYKQVKEIGLHAMPN